MSTLVAALEIVTRLNGKFSKIQAVLVEGRQVATLTNIGTKRKPQWRLMSCGDRELFELTFSSRDDAIAYVFDHTMMPMDYDMFVSNNPDLFPTARHAILTEAFGAINPAEFQRFGSFDTLSDEDMWNMRLEYEGWLDTLPSYQREEMERS